jgi:hypothetical protein
MLGIKNTIKCIFYVIKRKGENKMNELIVKLSMELNTDKEIVTLSVEEWMEQAKEEYEKLEQ